MVSNQQFRLKWNNHRNTVLQEFETLLHNNSFVDCTIGADGKYLKAHKIVLSACSPYLQNVFSEHFDKHPVILLKDVSFKELKCMIDYMYCGEVNISECELPSFLRTAQSLKIKGLAEDINEYDDSGASDNEHQEISSLTENGRTVEPNVEIHDDEGPPTKRSAPSLIYSNFAGRKRKSPNAINSGAPKSSNNSGSGGGGDKIIAAATSKTAGNVPVSSCADTENSDSSVCTTSKDNNVNKDVNDKKSNSQDDLQEHKNKAVVKEEPLDADDDNSSYEFVNNPCDDSDPLNEDSESNCANSGKNFNEVSIANVSSCNEAEANDGDDYDYDDEDHDDGKTTNVKEELLISELVTIEEDGTDEGKIRVRSCEELMSSPDDDGVPLNAETDIYVVTELNDAEEISDSDAQNRSSCNKKVDEVSYERVTEMVSVTCATIEPSAEESLAPENVAKERCRSQYSARKNASKMASRYFDNKSGCKKLRGKKRKAVSAESNDGKQPQKLGFRKILPAPMKPASATLLPATLLPVPLAAAPSATALMSSAQFSSQRNRTTSSKLAPAVDPKCSSGEHPSASGYRMITVSTAPSTSSTQTSQDVKRSSTGCTDNKEEGSQPILFSRVVLLNSSDVQSSSTQPIYTLPPVTSAKGGEIREVAFIRAPTTSPAAAADVAMKNIATDVKITPKNAPLLSFTQKFRRIAPLPNSEGGICRLCSVVFTSRSELTKHMPICSKTVFGKKGRKKNDT